MQFSARGTSGRFKACLHPVSFPTLSVTKSPIWIADGVNEAMGRGSSSKPSNP